MARPDPLSATSPVGCAGPAKPRITFALPSLLPVGGVERVQMAMAGQFLAMGIAVDMVLAFEPEEVGGVVPDGVRVIKLNAPRLRQFVRPFAEYLHTAQPDSVLVPMWPFNVYGILAHKLARSSARLVVSDHNTLSLQYAEWGALHRLAMRLSMGLFYPHADARMTVSAGVADDVSSLSGVRRDKFTVIHNPVPTPIKPPAPSDEAEAAWGGWKGRRIITVGRFKRQKNHALLLRAFKSLLGTLDARLMILGTGELEEETKALVFQEGLAGRVVFGGQVTDPFPYYSSADLFVLSSDYEGFGNVLVEALSCGIPVVSTDCRSGPAEILDNGRHGILVPVGDVDAMAGAMTEALNKDWNRQELRRRSEDFAVASVAHRWLGLLAPNLADCKIG